MTKSNEYWVFYVVQPMVFTLTVTIIDTSRLQFSRVTICKLAQFYSDLKPLFIEWGGLPASNQSVVCNQVINAGWISSIKVPIPGSKGGS